jgi:TM2 domain-containing membrane protein YozV|tara:strand:+ start:3589 stop:4026 length:438 start_codon:yes stop_codon:yes gene_type:complete
VSWFDFTADDEPLRQREEDLRARLGQLSDGQRKTYYQTYKKALRDPDTYAVLVYSLGFGLHHLYLGRYLRFALDFMTSVIFYINIIAWLFSGEFFSLWLSIVCLAYNVFDFVHSLFWSQRIVALYNVKTGERLAGRIESGVVRDA